MNQILGQKTKQGQKFLENGNRIPVTYINVAGNTVVSVKTKESDNYNAVQMGMGSRRKASKTRLGHAKKAALNAAPIFLREARISDEDSSSLPNLGDQIKATEVLTPGDMVDVIGTSKGKGFAGGVKRYGFHGGPKTHGQSDRHRAPGSIGQGTTPGRVYRGKRMAGRMGHEQVTIRNLKVMDVSDDEILIAGLVPGVLGSYIIIKKTGEDKKFVPLYKEPIAADQAPAEETTQDSVSADSAQELAASEKVEEPAETQPVEEVSESENVVEEKQEEAKEEVENA